jgi:hypothetical protein
MTTPPLKRGRPKKDSDTSGKQVRVYSWITPAERDWIAAQYGSVYAGLQQLVREKLSAKKSTK